MKISNRTCLPVVPPKLLHHQIPDHRVLELVVKINPVVYIRKEDRADHLLELAAFVCIAVVAGHHGPETGVGMNTGLNILQIQAMLFSELGAVNLIQLADDLGKEVHWLLLPLAVPFGGHGVQNSFLIP